MNMTNALRTAVMPGPSGEARALAPARAVSGVLSAVMAVTAAAGLVGGLYRDPDSVVALLRGYDVVALLIAVPLLVGALLRRTSRSVLVWAGVLVYAVYNDAFYLFGTELNVLFVLHAAVFALAVTALVLLLASVDVPVVAARWGRRTPVRLVGGVLVALGLSLAGMWAFAMARALGAGTALAEPSQLIVGASFTHLGAALDLSLLVPGYVLAGVLLWRRAPWGYLLATVLLVAGVLHQLAYMTALLFQGAADIPGATAFDPVEPVIVAAFAVAAALMLAPHGSTRDDGGAR